jgi:dTDP-4-dehydrorhamnose 3,5-epimerase|tara:strand:+ start:467 stop:892 length:426 start_codon:yes stop_codon:yes gene_type:complete
MLDTILVTRLNQIPVEGGNVLHAMKQSDDGYSGFGEAYFSWVSKGSIKAWKRHTNMTLNLVVPVGKVKFVFYCSEKSNPVEFRTEEIGEDNYVRLTVPPGIWFGFQGLESKNSLVMNIASIPHDNNEVERLLLDDINYNWS